MKAIIVIVAVLLVPVAAQAQDAEQLYNDGQQAFDAGRYDDAIVAWNRSLTVSGENALWFNLGQAHRLAGHACDALRAYREFVRLVPSSEQRPVAEDFLKELQPKCREKPTQTTGGATNGTATVDLGRPAEHTPGRTKRIAGLAVGGTGVALVVTGLLFGARASSIGDEVTAECAAGCVWQDIEAEQARGRRYEGYQWVLTGVGSAAIIGGGLLWFFGDRERGREQGVTVGPAAGGAAISWSGAW